MTEFVILGGGGHALVCADILRLRGLSVLGYLGPSLSEFPQEMPPYLGTDKELKDWDPVRIRLVNGIGSTGDPSLRKRVYEESRLLGYHFPILVHPQAVVSSSVKLEEGVQVMAGTVIQAGVVIGANSILNTRSSVDHHCRIGSHAHVAPGAVLCGNVAVGEGSHIGAGATVIQNVSVGRYSTVGAGAVVVRDISDHVTVYGVPAREAAK